MYLQAVVICCLAIARSSLCYDNVNEESTYDEIEMAFRLTANSAPEHELVPIRRFGNEEFGRDGSIITGATQKVWLKTFGNDVERWLYPGNSFLIDESTPVYHAQYSATEPGNVKFDKQDGAMKRIGQLYVDNNYPDSSVIGTDASGNARVDGYIDRKRRSIPESEYISLADGPVVYHKTQKNLRDEFAFSASNRTNLRERSDRSAEQEEIPYTLHPQILLVVENSLYRKMGSNDTDLLEYLLAFWNGVDLKYRSLERPQIRLSISAIIIATEPRGTPYISDYPISDGVFDANMALPKAKYFFSDIKEKFRPETYDIAVTMTTQTFGGEEMDGIVGLAYRGAACQRTSKTVDGIVMVHDMGDFFGVHVAAQKLGRSFGMKYDNEDVVDCKSSDGYIMAEDMASHKNSWTFSQCSLDDFDSLLHNNGLKCLYNVPEKTESILPKILPGILMAPSRVCELNGYSGGTCQRPDSVNICGNVYCYGGRYCTEIPVPVPEGERCGLLEENMFCLRGRCTQIPESTAEEIALV